MRSWMRKRTMVALVTTLLMLLNLLSSVGDLFSPSQALAITNTLPSTTSATSLYSSNWQDLVGIWMDSKLSQTDT